MCSEKCSKSLVVNHTFAVHIGHLHLFDKIDHNLHENYHVVHVRNGACAAFVMKWIKNFLHLIWNEPDFAYDFGDDDFGDFGDDDFGDDDDGDICHNRWLYKQIHSSVRFSNWYTKESALTLHARNV